MVASLQELADLGYQEVVLTGVDLGQYGQDLPPPMDLAALVRRLQERPWPFRVRLSSLEPQEVTGELLRELAAWRAVLPPLPPAACRAAPHRCWPPWVGLTTPGYFIDLVREIHRLFPEAGLGLDVLVGFPGEIRRRLRGHPGPGGGAPGDLSPRLSLLPPARHPRGANDAACPPGRFGNGPGPCGTWEG